MKTEYQQMLEDLQNGLITFQGGMPDRPVNPAEGYNETADILTQTLDGVPIDQLYEEFQQVLAMYNRQRAPLLEALTFTVNAPFEQVMQAVTADFEEADEWGQPVGIRLGKPWSMGYDLRYFDLGIRYTFRFLGRAPASQIRALQSEALDADQRLIYKTVLTQLFTNVTKVATLEDTGTVVNVYPLYNADSPVAPPSWKSYSHTTSHNHYLASGNATVRSLDLDAMETHMYHHGYLESGDLILLCNLQEFNTIRKFRVTANDSYDYIPATTSPAYPFLTAGQLVGGAPAGPSAQGIATFPGFQGKYGRWNIFVEDMLPAGYMLGAASKGARNPDNLVGIREHEHPGLRGLKLIPQFERYPLREAFYHHALGSGVRHRGAGVVMQVTTGSYTVPTFTFGGPGGR